MPDQGVTVPGVPSLGGHDQRVSVPTDSAPLPPGTAYDLSDAASSGFLYFVGFF